MPAYDPPETNAVIRRERSRRSCLIEGSISAPGRQPKFGIATGLSPDGDKAAVGGEASAPGLAIGKQIISICPRSRCALTFFRPNSKT